MTRALRRRMLVAVAVLAAGLACVMVLGDVARRLELSTVDARFGLRGERSPGDLVVVGVDDVTFDAFDEQWPLLAQPPRRRARERRGRRAARDRLRRPVHGGVATTGAPTTG